MKVKRLTNLLRRSFRIGARSAAASSRQWPNRSGWAEDSAVPDELRRKWIADGYLILRGVIDRQTLDRFNATVSRVRATVEEGKDEHGFGERIGQLHQKEPSLLDLAANGRIIGFLIWALGEPPVLFGSLNFERGTQQEAHVDAIFFWPEPAYSMAGVWVALEDVHPDAGPVFYLPGSHVGHFPHSDEVVAMHPELAETRNLARAGKLPADQKAQLVSQLLNAWTVDFLAANNPAQATRMPILLEAGDVLVWHSLLAHGGSARNNSALSRRSVVFHYFGETASLYTSEQFALYGRDELPHQRPLQVELRSYGPLRYMRFPYFVTYSGGREIVHPLTK